MKAIVNVNRDWAIGRENDLLVYIPADMKYFRTVTKGKTVVMGRKTLESFPGKKPLKGRINIVLTRDLSRIPEESKAAADAVIDGSTAEGVAETVRLMKERHSDAFPQSAGEKSSDTPETILVIIAASVENLVLLCREAGAAGKDVYDIGGASIYKKLLPYTDICLVTVNDYLPPADAPADSWFPNLDEDPQWERTETGEMQEHDGIHFCFCTYKRVEE